ncbi:MAG: c-type cytochrome, partial [Aliarcobacter sp.]
DPTLYGKGTRCMSNCIEGNVEDLVMRINEDLTKTANEPLSTVRELPKVDKSLVKRGQIEYENAGCSACHANAAIGAPVLGDKDAWEKLLKNGIEQVYYNGINGINSMPPRGGTDLSDEELKIIIDYMVDSSK